MAYMKDYTETIRRSVKRDFAKANFKRLGQSPKTPRPKHIRRVVGMTDTSGYAKFRRLVVGKLVRILGRWDGGGWFVQFVRDEDRRALNRAAGWSNDKSVYLLDGVKLD